MHTNKVPTGNNKRPGLFLYINNVRHCEMHKFAVKKTNHRQAFRKRASFAL